MKYLKLLIASFGILSILITGCSNPVGNEKQNIVVQKGIGEENKYEDIKEISDSKQVQQVIDIINDIHWENAKVDMERPAEGKYAQLENNKSAELFEIITGEKLSELK